MDLNELENLVKNTKWFSMLGQPFIRNNTITISNLEVFNDVDDFFPFSEKKTKENALVSKMLWLPSSKHEVDLIHQNTLQEKAICLNMEEEIKSTRIKFHKLTLQSLRMQEISNNRLLKTKMHDFILLLKKVLYLRYEGLAKKFLYMNRDFGVLSWTFIQQVIAH